MNKLIKYFFVMLLIILGALFLLWFCGYYSYVVTNGLFKP